MSSLESRLRSKYTLLVLVLVVVGVLWNCTLRRTGWDLVDKTDPITDERTVSTQLWSLEGDSSAGLYVVCVQSPQREPEWAMYIDWGRRLGAARSVAVMTRYGTEQAVTAHRVVYQFDDEDWTVISSNVWGAPGGGIRKLREVDEFKARVVTGAKDSLTVAWDVRGLAAALKPLIAVCGEPPATPRWSLHEQVDPDTSIRTLTVATWAPGNTTSGPVGRVWLRVNCVHTEDGAPLWGLAIDWGQSLGRGSTAVVEARYGTELTRRANWLVAAGQTTHIHIPRNGLMRDRVQKLLAVNRFSVQTVTATRQTLVAEFDVREMAAALVPLTTACGNPP